jgi:large repetitive protein
LTATGGTVTANVTAPSVPDSNLTNNTDTKASGAVFADVTTVVNLPGSASASSVITGTVTYSNSGGAGATATAVVGTLTLSNGQQITYTVGDLAPGASSVQTFTTTMPATTGTAALNATSTVATSTPESNTGNNTGTASAGSFIPPGTISGRAFYDKDRDRVYSSGDAFLTGYTVELLQVQGTATVVVGSATTDVNGQYSISNQQPGTGYQLRFKSPQGNVILGTPFNQTALTVGGNPSTGSNSLTAAVSPSLSVAVAGLIDNITIYAGDNTIEQNLPLDPSGVVYDSVTRSPLGGASITLVGPAGFNPATHLVSGSNVFVTDAATGAYQFLFSGTPPSGVYSLVVTPPPNYAPPNATLGGVAAPSPTLVVPPGITDVQPQSTPPAVGVTGSPGTAYYLSLNFNFASPGEVFHNHIPLDALATAGALLVNKVGDKTVAELGDSIRYTIRLTNTSGAAVGPVRVEDNLPAGFRYIPGTSRLGGVVLADPSGGTGRALVFALPGVVAAGTTVELSYFVRLGVGSQQGDGINRAVGVFDGPSGPVRSNVATFKVKVQGGVFSNEGCIAGKVYTDCDGDHMQDNASGSREIGIPGVRLVMLNGSYVITDAEGKYSMCGLKSQTHVVKVDRTTLPKGALLLPSSNRNAGDGGSIFVDMKGGELSSADFIVGSCTPEVLDQVKARRAQGGGATPETEKGLDFKILPGGESPRQQILPAPRQHGNNVSVQGGIAK